MAAADSAMGLLRIISTGMVALALSDGADAGHNEGRTGSLEGQGQAKQTEAARGV